MENMTTRYIKEGERKSKTSENGKPAMRWKDSSWGDATPCVSVSAYRVTHARKRNKVEFVGWTNITERFAGMVIEGSTLSSRQSLATKGVEVELRIRQVESLARTVETIMLFDTRRAQVNIVRTCVMDLRTLEDCTGGVALDVIARPLVSTRPVFEHANTGRLRYGRLDSNSQATVERCVMNIVTGGEGRRHVGGRRSSDAQKRLRSRRSNGDGDWSQTAGCYSGVEWLKVGHKERI